MAGNSLVFHRPFLLKLNVRQIWFCETKSTFNKYGNKGQHVVVRLVLLSVIQRGAIIGSTSSLRIWCVHQGPEGDPLTLTDPPTTNTLCHRNHSDQMHSTPLRDWSYPVLFSPCSNHLSQNCICVTYNILIWLVGKHIETQRERH